ncbi:uncharacterized protein [Porites lutea]|uniref:uncharacterized protein isoform X2 n=1 Tax=Porites lutea TaxID=51062 RepID=UPI003CC5FE2B
MTLFKELVVAALFGSLTVMFCTCADESADQSICGGCDLKTRCLNDAITCLTGKGVSNQTQAYEGRFRQLEQEIATLKAQLSKAGQPGGFAKLDQKGRLPQNVLTAGYDQYSAFDLAWQSVHMAAAAACRGSTANGGSGCCNNQVMVRNTADKKTCSQICSQSSYPNCDGEVSVYGRERKATKNGEIVGSFYNYHCNGALHGGSEASQVNEAIMSSSVYFSFCCCRK